MQMLGARRGTARWHCFTVSNQVAEGFNEPFVRSAAAADDIHEAFFQEWLHLCRHLFGRLTVLPQTIGQSGVGVSNNAERALGRQFFEKGQHVGSPEGTVQANGKKREMRHGRKKRSQRLPRERAPGLVCHRGGEDYGQLFSLFFHHVGRRTESSLGVERIEGRFNDETVHAAVHQRGHLLAVGSGKRVEVECAQRGVAHVGAKGTGAVGRAHGTEHIARLVGRLFCKKVGFGSRQSCSFDIQLCAKMLATVIGHGDALRTERICFNEVRPRFKVSAMYFAHHVRPRQVEQVVVAFLQRRAFCHHAAAKVGIREAETLDHRANSAVEEVYLVVVEVNHLEKII